MSVQSEAYRNARDIAVVLLRNNPKPTPDDVRIAATAGAKALNEQDSLDIESLIADLLHSFSIYAGGGFCTR